MCSHYYLADNKLSVVLVLVVMSLVPSYIRAQVLPPPKTPPYVLERRCLFKICCPGPAKTYSRLSVFEEAGNFNSFKFWIESGVSLELLAESKIFVTQHGLLIATERFNIYSVEDSDLTVMVEPGDSLEVVDYGGEDFWTVWYKESYWEISRWQWIETWDESELLPTNSRQLLKRHWWSRIRTEEGRSGWIYREEASVQVTGGCP